MKSRIILFTMALLLSLWGCDKEEISTFTSDDAGIYFQRVNSYIYGSTTEYYGDSISYSFASAKATAKTATLSATVRTMGKVVDYDRPFKVVIDEEGTNGIEGKHFEVNLDTAVVPAGKSTAYVRVRFNRTEDMMEKAVRVALRLEDNEYFKCYFPEYKNTNAYASTGAQIHGTLFAFSISEMYTEPGYWTSFGGDFFGPWTSKKYVIVNQVCGLTPSDWANGGYAGTKVQYGRFSFFALSVQKYLQEQADAGTPVIDVDGKYMQLASSYSVDYSKYE